MQTIMTGVKELVYNAPKNPNLMQFTVANLQPGMPYGFTLIAFNFNGPSEESQMAVFKSCI
jgi:hypothetical protein